MTKADGAKTSLRRRTVLAAVAAAMGLTVVGSAEAAAPLVDVQIIDRTTGQAAQVWRHAGRLYVAGRPGARYSLRVTNNTPGRVLAVMSVDGVNVLTRQTASYGQRGYVFGPYETNDVSGWRKSDSEIAAFTFAPLSRSYAARTGRPNDVGVIGVAVFEERTYAPPPLAVAPAAPEWVPPGDQESAGQAQALVIQGAPAPAPPPSDRAAPSAQMARPSERLGTGHGRREWSQVTVVPFERATTYPRFVLQIEYDSYENLVACGVIPRYRPRPAPPHPRPFPEDGYVPDPPYGQ